MSILPCCQFRRRRRTARPSRPAWRCRWPGPSTPPVSVQPPSAQVQPVGRPGPRSTIAATAHVVRALVGGRHGHEHRVGSPVTEAATSCRRRSRSAGARDVGVVQHRVAPAADAAVLAYLVLEEDVDQPLVQVGPVRGRQVEPGALDRRPDPIGVERVASPNARFVAPPIPRTLPTTTTWARSSSTPDEQEATAEYRPWSCRRPSSVGISISPSRPAVAEPGAAVGQIYRPRGCARSRPWRPRPWVSRIVSMVSSGVSVCT